MMKMQITKEQTLAFTGHRFYEYRLHDKIVARLTATILEAYENGVRCFVSGFAMGFDLIAAETVLTVKNIHTDICLVAVLPYREQSERYNQYSKRKYDDLLSKADQTIVLSENYYTRCFLDRDDFLVENSSMIVAYYDGRNRGGTFYTMNQAERHKVPVVNLY